MAALDAGQAAGGDTRGMQSAAMLIVKKNGGVWLNNDVVLRLQVDDSPEPIKELRRLVEMNARRVSRRWFAPTVLIVSTTRPRELRFRGEISERRPLRPVLSTI